MATPPAQHLIKPLTSIRFFAAMIVIMYHSGSGFINTLPNAPTSLKSFLLNGYVGVPFFFLLSGFILHLTYRGRLIDRKSLWNFAVARFARIYPVYLLAIVVMVPFVSPFQGWRDVPQFFGLQWWVTSPNPFSTMWNGPSWTVSVEIFFYFCFPFLSAMAGRLRCRSIAIMIGAILAVCLITGSPSFWCLRPANFDWLRWVPTPIVRLPEFLLGVLVSELHLRREGRPFPIPAWLPPAAAVAIMCVSHDQWVGTAVTFLAALAVVAIAGSPTTRFTHFLQHRWLVLMGAASYSLYLLHQFVHFSTVAVLGPSKATVLIQYPAVLILSVIVFLRFEEPAREWIRRRGQMKPSAMEQVVGKADP
jgi:peptidoglycan/LPS O-acetylase OafA/YrhL